MGAIPPQYYIDKANETGGNSFRLLYNDRQALLHDPFSVYGSNIRQVNTNPNVAVTSVDPNFAKPAPSPRELAPNGAWFTPPASVHPLWSIPGNDLDQARTSLGVNPTSILGKRLPPGVPTVTTGGTSSPESNVANAKVAKQPKEATTKKSASASKSSGKKSLLIPRSGTSNGTGLGASSGIGLQI